VAAGTTLRYDSAGNRRDPGGSYTLGNRITGFNGCTYVTDPLDGNVTSRTCGGQTVTFTWTAENRLASLMVNGQTTTFDYNAAGRLVKKTTGGVARHFLWERDNLLAELDGAGTGKIAEYSYYPGLDNPHALIVGTTKYFAHRDGLGNVIALTDEAKVVQRSYDYDAWGNAIGGSDGAGFNGVDRARFKGALWLGPEIDVYYMRARWYEPKSGRFLSEDPIGLAGGINSCVYAGDDPVNTRDPTGLHCELKEIPGYWYSACQVGRKDCEWYWQPAEFRMICSPSGAGGDALGSVDPPTDPRVPRSGGGSLGQQRRQPAPDVGEEAERKCTQAVAMALATGILDASFFVGVGAVIKAGRVARVATREAAWLLTDNTTAWIRAGNAQRVARLQRGFLADEYRAGAAVSLAEPSSGFWDFVAALVPGPATIRAVRHAISACNPH